MSLLFFFSFFLEISFFGGGGWEGGRHHLLLLGLLRNLTVDHSKVIGRGHRVPPAGLPIEQALGEYSLS